MSSYTVQTTGPKGLNPHPLHLLDDRIGIPCPACGGPFQEGEWVVHIPLGPGASSEARKRCTAGYPYWAAEVTVHAVCAGHEGLV